MKREIFLVTAVLGLLVGFALSGINSRDSSYCNRIEDNLRENRSFNGSIGCYPPGVLEVNISDRVENNSELRCVCRIIDNDGIRLFPIAVSN